MRRRRGRRSGIDQGVPARSERAVRSSGRRTLAALCVVALLALLAFTALFVGGAFTGHDAVSASATGPAVEATHEHDAAPMVRAIHQQPSTHARNLALAALVAVAVGLPTASRRLRLARTDRPRVLRVVGLPSGRAPPAPRIA